MKTNVIVSVTQNGNVFTGLVKSAKTGRQMFATAPKSDAATAEHAARAVAADRKWNEVIS